MPAHRQLVVRTTAGLLSIVMAAACSVVGPDLHIAIDNTDGPKEVTVTVDWSGPGMTGGGDATNILAGNGAEWSVPLGSTWEIKVDGKHVIGSGDRTDLALPSPGQRRDLMISIQVGVDGTVMLLDAH
jgi:hypothetical protein